MRSTHRGAYWKDFPRKWDFAGWSDDTPVSSVDSGHFGQSTDDDSFESPVATINPNPIDPEDEPEDETEAESDLESVISSHGSELELIHFSFEKSIALIKFVP